MLAIHPTQHLHPRRLWALAAIVGYVALCVAANIATNRLGLIPVGFGLVATAGTYCAGLVLAARDAVHTLAGRTAVYACILAGTLASAATAGAKLALASGIAFAVSETVDLLVYQPLHRRGFLRAVTISNLVGALVDTMLFLFLAGFAVTTTGVGGQLLGKTTATLAFVTVVAAVRALLRHRLRPHRA